MATNKTTKSKDTKNQKYALPQDTKAVLDAAIAPCIVHGRASVAAEAARRYDLDHGAPQTHTALNSLYGFGHELLKRSDKERASWISSLDYELKDGTKAKVPYHKPAKENCFIAITKPAFPRCEDGTRSRYATILFAALKADVSVEGFVTWLAGPHSRDTDEVGTGVKGAYEAHKKVRSPIARKHGDGEPEWPEIAKAALKGSAAVERPSTEAPVTTYKGGFCVALCHIQEGDPSMSLKFMSLDKALVEKILLLAAAEAVRQPKGEAAEPPVPIIPLHHPEPETAAEEMA